MVRKVVELAGLTKGEPERGSDLLAPFVIDLIMRPAGWEASWTDGLLDPPNGLGPAAGRARIWNSDQVTDWFSADGPANGSACGRSSLFKNRPRTVMEVICMKFRLIIRVV